MENINRIKVFMIDFFGNIWHLIQGSLRGLLKYYTKLLQAFLTILPNKSLIGKSFRRKEPASLHALEMEYQTDYMIVIVSIIVFASLFLFENTSYRGLIAPILIGFYCSIVTLQEINTLNSKKQPVRNPSW